MKSNLKACAVAGAVALFAASAPLYAQNQAAPQSAQAGAGNINWNQQEIRNGISVDRLIGMDVRGQNGNSLGEVQNVILTADKVAAIVVEYGGFLNIGDTHFRVPWSQVKFGSDMDHVLVPLTQQNAEQYQERRSKEKVQTAAGEFRARDVIGDTAVLQDGTRYGEIRDLIATRNGDVKALVVNADFEGQRGVYGYPYRGDAFDFNANNYRLPYDRATIAAARPFDYKLVNIAEPRGTGATMGTGATTGTGAAGEQRREQREMPVRQSRG
jgi:ribosomal 30S subunit maturation factor RimM